MNTLITFAIILLSSLAVSPKKILNPETDIKFDHVDDEHHSVEASKEDDNGEDAPEKDHHGKTDYHHDHHQKHHHDQHLAAHELLHRAHELAKHDHSLSHHDHVLASHVFVPHPPVLPFTPLDKHTSYLLVPLPHNIIPAKPGALYDNHVKKRPLFVPTTHH